MSPPERGSPRDDKNYNEPAPSFIPMDWFVCLSCRRQIPMGQLYCKVCQHYRDKQTKRGIK